MRLSLMIVLASLLLVPLTPLATGQTTITFTQYGEQKETVVYDFEGPDRNNSARLEFPAVTVTGASMTITGEAYDGSYPTDVELQVRNDVWRYSGQGYGALGFQNSFSTGGYSQGAAFADGGSRSMSLKLPADATITDATINLTGYAYGTGDLRPYQLGSTDTNGGSYSQTPDLARDASGNLYAVWLDDGDLEQRKTNWDNILFAKQSGGSWDDPLLLGKTTSTYQMPRVVVDGSDVYVAWIYKAYPNRILLLYSADGGDSWSTTKTFRADGGNYIYDYDLVTAGSDLHLLWSDSGNMSGAGYDYDIFYTSSSDDGDTWDDPDLVSAASNSTAYHARLAVDGNNVHAVWTEWTNATSDGSWRYLIQYRKYQISSGLWGPQMLMQDDEVNGYRPSVATATVLGTNYVHVAWYDYISYQDGYEVQIRTSSDGGNTWGTQPQNVSDEDEDDGYYSYPYPPTEVAADSNSRVYVTWTRLPEDRNQPRRSMLATSSDRGENFGDPQAVDLGGEAKDRIWVAMAAGDDGELALAWGDRDATTGASTDMDIIVRQSGDAGESWGSVAQLSQQYYESVESSSPELVTTQDYLHMVYWDGGDVSDNGNNAHNDDGDIFYRRSADDGVTWSDPMVLSTQGDTVAYTPRNSYLYHPAMAASGNHVYAVWVDRNSDPDFPYFTIFLSHSPDQGSSWDEPVMVSEGYAQAYAPSVAAEGSRVHVVYQEYQMGYQIIMRTSRSYGQSWDFAVTVSDSDVQNNYDPAAGVSGGRVHVAWYAYYDDGERWDNEIFYARSSDQGNSWTSPERLTNSTSRSAMYPGLGADDSGLYVAWRDYGDFDEDGRGDYDIVMRVSLDYGDSWETTVLISDDDDYRKNNYQSYPAVAAGNGLVYVVWMERPTSGRNDETWVLDDETSNWTQVHPEERPEPTYYHAMAYVSTPGAVVSFGGLDDSGYSNDTWLYFYEYNNWSRTGSKDSPTARYGHAMATDYDHNAIVMFGGYGQNETGYYGYRNDTWIYFGDMDTWVLAEGVGGPTSRYMHAMAWDNVSGQVVLYGGYGKNETGYYGYRNDTWLFDMDSMTWTQLETEGNAGRRYLHRMAGDHSGRVALFGGYSQESGYSDETWVLDSLNATWTELQTTSGPEARRYHAMTHDRANDRLLLFGGYTLTNPYYAQDTWILDLEAGAWTQLETPSAATARYYHGIAYDEANARTILFGGYVSTTYDLYLRFSRDQGENWSAFVEVTDNPSSKITGSFEPAGLTIGERAYVAFRDDGDIGGAGADDTDVFVRATRGNDYPDDPTFEVGKRDGSPQWQWTGEFNTNNSPVRWDSASSPGAQGVSFKQALTDALAAADTTIDANGVEMATIDLTVTSDTRGVMWLSRLSITYDVTLTYTGGGLVTQLNKRVDAAQNKGDDFAYSTLWVTSQTKGRVIITDLAIETQESDIELVDLQLTPSNPKQGEEVEVTAILRNTGEANARVQIGFWYDSLDLSHEIANQTLTVYADGEDWTAKATWRAEEVPSGTHDVIAAVLDTFPLDSTANSAAWVKKITDLYIPATYPEVFIEVDGFVLEDDPPIEGSLTDIVVLLNNRGERTGLTDIYVYEGSEGGTLLMEELGVEVYVGELRERGVRWKVHEIDQLYLMVRDNETGELIDERYMPLEVMILVRFEQFAVSYTPLQVSDGTTVDFSFEVRNTGSFPVSASVQASLRKGTNTIALEPTYWPSEVFQGGELKLYESNARFSEALVGDALYGDWEFSLKVFNINPVRDEDQGLWDPEQLSFEYQGTVVTVSQPPEVSLDSVGMTPTNPTAGDTVKVQVSISNYGESDATGSVRLFLVDYGKSENLGTFAVKADEEVNLEYNWTVDPLLSGETPIEIQLIDIDPSEEASPFALLDNKDTVEIVVQPLQVTVQQPGSSDSDGHPTLIIAAVLLVLIGGLASTVVVYRRSQITLLPTKAVGGAAAQTSPTALAAAVTIQCPTCQTQLKITDTRRPLTIGCPGCQTQLQLDQ